MPEMVDLLGIMLVTNIKIAGSVAHCGDIY